MRVSKRSPTASCSPERRLNERTDTVAAEHAHARGVDVGDPAHVDEDVPALAMLATRPRQRELVARRANTTFADAPDRIAVRIGQRQPHKPRDEDRGEVRHAGTLPG